MRSCEVKEGADHVEGLDQSVMLSVSLQNNFMALSYNVGPYCEGKEHSVRDDGTHALEKESTYSAVELTFPCILLVKG